MSIENGQSIKTSNIWSTRRRKTKQKHSTICVGHHYAQENTKPSHMFLMQKYVATVQFVVDIV